jgi:hypothetical protein
MGFVLLPRWLGGGASMKVTIRKLASIAGLMAIVVNRIDRCPDHESH